MIGKRWRSDRRGGDPIGGGALNDRQPRNAGQEGRPAAEGRCRRGSEGTGIPIGIGSSPGAFPFNCSLVLPGTVVFDQLGDCFFPSLSLSFPSFLALGSWLGSLFSSACLLAFFVLFVHLFRRLVPVSLLLFPSLLFVSVARTFNSSKVLSPCSAHFTQHPSRLLQVSREVPPPPTVPPPILLSLGAMQGEKLPP